MVRIEARHNMSLHLGREGENLALEVAFDISDWQEKYGLGTVSLIARRPCDEAPYPCVIRIEDSTVIWEITSADTAWHGNSGQCELQYHVNDVLVKSEIWRTYVVHAMDDPSTEAPEAYKGWVSQVLEAGQKVHEAVSSSAFSASESRDAARNASTAATVAQDAACQVKELAKFMPPKATSADAGKILIIGTDGTPVWTAVENAEEVSV